MPDEGPRIIALASGKGGVGKTALTANLGVALGMLGKKVLLIDADIQMANLGLMLGMEQRPVTLQDVLLGHADPRDAVYNVRENVKFVPSGLSLEKMLRVDEEMLGEVVQKLAQGNDFVLIDCPPGVGPDALAALNASKEVLVLTMAEPVSVADAMKLAIFAERRLGLTVTGVVVNMYKGMKHEMKEDEIQKLVQSPVLAVIPEDPLLRKSSIEGIPVVVRHPDAPSSLVITGLASKLAGVAKVEMRRPKKPGLFEAIKNLFKGFPIIRHKPKLQEARKGEENIGEVEKR